MPNYKTTIGLEIHAELKTVTKMFCNSKNDPDETHPNVNVCPICMGHPGVLPTINKEALKHVLKVGIALNGELADFTEFDRKNYFYPDIPKGYQISQYQYPLVKGGSMNNVLITRVHLEEDTARSLHDKEGGHSLVDFNRAGVPLMELVTEPVITSAEEAGIFARELQLLLRYLGASDANMEKGQMRVEANISIGIGTALGTKVEVKNLNSFRSVERAIVYEEKRQIELLERGEKMVQETRGWDEQKQVTFSQRIKEESHDYRYFPDPDLPKLKLSYIPEFSVSRLREEIPELPWEKRRRYVKEFAIKEEDASFIVRHVPLSEFFEKVAPLLVGRESVQRASNYITSDLVGLLKEKIDTIPFTHEHFVSLMNMVDAGDVSSRGAKDILAALAEEDEDPGSIAERKGLLQKSDVKELRGIVESVIRDNTLVAEEYKMGKENLLQYLVGQAMKKTRGAANPQVLQKLFREML